MADVVTRAKALMMDPAREWAAIAAEPADTKGLLLSYAAILSLIPRIVAFLAVLLLSGFVVLRLGVTGLIIQNILHYILGLGIVWAIGKIIQMLAPMFGGVDDEISAMKLSVYSPTAAWVASIFVLIPFIGFLLALAGVAYSIYLFYLGAPAVTKVPADKAIPFTAAVAVASILLGIIVSWLITRLIPLF